MSDPTQPQSSDPDRAAFGSVLLPDDPDRLGRFTLHRRLRAGGMGLAYLAQADTGNTVVVKTLLPGHANDVAYRSRFRREILAASSVRSSFTAPVLASDLDADRQWVAIAFIPGPTLDTLVADLGPLEEAHLAALALALAEGLDQLHSLRLVHRDLKPANIICADDGPKLIDFGIAEFEHDDLLTVAELGHMGSPGWLAPERLTGNPAPKAAEDIYAWGCVCWYAATGKHPSRSSTWTSADIDQKQLPSALGGLLARALAVDPRERPKASDIVSRLHERQPYVPTADLVSQGWADDGPPTARLRGHDGASAGTVSSPAATPSPRAWRWWPLPRWAVVSIVLPVMLLAGASGYAIYDNTRPVAGAAGPTINRLVSPTSSAAATTGARPTSDSGARAGQPHSLGPRPTVTVTATSPPTPSRQVTVTRCEEVDFPALSYPGRPLDITGRSRFSPHLRLIQDYLNFLGFGCLVEDGYFGPATRDAVTEFQREYGLRVTGIVNDRTFESAQSLTLAGADGCAQPC